MVKLSTSLLPFSRIWAQWDILLKDLVYNSDSHIHLGILKPIARLCLDEIDHFYAFWVYKIKLTIFAIKLHLNLTRMIGQWISVRTSDWQAPNDISNVRNRQCLSEPLSLQRMQQTGKWKFLSLLESIEV